MKALDLTGRTFGELTALEPVQIHKKRGWLCQCSCGNHKQIPTFQLTGGHNKTCGDPVHKQSIKVGDRFGKLVVAEVYRDSKNRRYLAVCDCDCGGVKPNASFKNLQRNATTHCGCSPDHTNKGLPIGVGILNALISSYRSNASRKGHQFTLSNDQCDSLFQGTCYFCGQPPSAVFTKKNIKGAYTYSGIDRIDSSKGYTPDNVMSCCTECNYLKGNKTNAAFIARIKRICSHHKEVRVLVLPT